VHVLDAVVAAAGLLALALAAARWLRVAQREGWAAFSATAWAARWWLLPPNGPIAAVAVVSLVAAPVFRPSALVTALAVACGPFGLTLRGHRPGPLVWTAHCRRTAGLLALVVGALVGASLLIGMATAAVLAGLLAGLTPVLVDLAAAVAGGPEPADGTVPTGPPADEVLRELASALPTTRRVLVAGGPSGAAGRAVGERAASIATHLLIVGRHARADLQDGAAAGPTGCTVVLCRDPDHATAWIDAETDAKDTVRWLSVPPDHVP
jgi:hypothetical protein